MSSENGKKRQVTLDATQSQKSHTTNVIAVDLNDHSGADYTTSIKNKLPIFEVVFWVLECVVHVNEVIVY